jgi:alkanesulfonate monooxygenase SsuD/methylene tetrahydromethanopterin reductase-like flavin-dependent oxidoreductase (luciferase family)
MTIGVIFQPSFPPERLQSAVRAAEAAGVDEVWLWEDCFRESGLATATAALAWTDSIRLAIGVLPMPFRNVALAAMELATIERLFPGRLVPGVGHGVQRWMSQVGARVESPLTLMREYLPTLRSLLAGDEVTIDGRYVQLDAVRLDWPPATRLPVWAAGEGPKTLRLSGELADGTVLTSGTSLEATRAGVAVIREGRVAAGRPGDHPVAIYLMTAFGGGEARDRMEAEFNDWGMQGEKRVAAVGSVDEVVDVVGTFHAAGATTVVLQPTAGEPDLEGFIARSGEVARLV